jgi:hypothetical protein
VCGNCEKRFGSLEHCDFGPLIRGTQYCGERNLLPSPGARRDEMRLQIAGSTHNGHYTEQARGQEEVLDVRLCPSLGGGLLDPFQTHPTSRISGVDRLLNYCKFSGSDHSHLTTDEEDQTWPQHSINLFLFSPLLLQIRHPHSMCLL